MWNYRETLSDSWRDALRESGSMMSRRTTRTIARQSIYASIHRILMQMSKLCCGPVLPSYDGSTEVTEQGRIESTSSGRVAMMRTLLGLLGWHKAEADLHNELREVLLCLNRTFHRRRSHSRAHARSLDSAASHAGSRQLNPCEHSLTYPRTTSKLFAAHQRHLHQLRRGDHVLTTVPCHQGGCRSIQDCRDADQSRTVSWHFSHQSFS